MPAEPRPPDDCSHPLGAGPLAGFLADSDVCLVGRLDDRGRVIAANPLLRRWLLPGPNSTLASALSPSSAWPWRQALDESGPAGSHRSLDLRFGRGGGPSVLFRCLLHRGTDGHLWLLGVPTVEGIGLERRLRKRRQARRDRALRRARRIIRRLARTDPLTGLANRPQGEAWLRRSVAEAARSGRPLACLMIDLDHFKAVNDSLGHLAGDQVLRASARALARGLGRSGHLARYGGDEFLVVLPGASLDAASARVARLRSCLLGRGLTASFGLACCQGGESGESLLGRADAALLLAKQGGRDQLELAPPPD